MFFPESLPAAESESSPYGRFELNTETRLDLSPNGPGWRNCWENPKKVRQQLELAARNGGEYILVLTDLDAEAWSAPNILELYRCRWHIELAFKRFKGLLKLGHLPKKDPDSPRAWTGCG